MKCGEHVHNSFVVPLETCGCPVLCFAVVVSPKEEEKAGMGGGEKKDE